MLAREDENTEELLATWQHQEPAAAGQGAGARPVAIARTRPATPPDLAGLPSTDLAELIQELTDQMKHAAAELQFEVAARLRDEI